MSSCRSTEFQQGYRKVDIGGCRLHMLVTGRGTPVVVLESGLGDTTSAWERVQPQVAEFACAISYDRAGLGMSDPATANPRTSAQIARELHTALHRAGISPPYVLVGHSMGGFHVRLFAHQFPTEVAGLVLVDPSAEDWDDIMRTQFRDEYREAMASRAQRRPEGPKREAAAWEESKQEARAAWPLPDVPVVLFTSVKGKPDGSDAKNYQKWTEVHEEWLRRIPRGTHVVTEKSGHYVQFTEPKLVVNAISNIVAGARSGASERRR